MRTRVRRESARSVATTYSADEVHKGQRVRPTQQVIGAAPNWAVLRDRTAGAQPPDLNRGMDDLSSHFYATVGQLLDQAAVGRLQVCVELSDGGAAERVPSRAAGAFGRGTRRHGLSASRARRRSARRSRSSATRDHHASALQSARRRKLTREVAYNLVRRQASISVSAGRHEYPMWLSRFLAGAGFSGFGISPTRGHSVCLIPAHRVDPSRQPPSTRPLHRRFAGKPC